MVTIPHLLLIRCSLAGYENNEYSIYVLVSSKIKKGISDLGSIFMQVDHVSLAYAFTIEVVEDIFKW